MSGGGVFLGVDVGTGSARAGLFDDKGKLLGSTSNPIQIWKEKDCVEQSTTDIWHAVCTAVKSACLLANVGPEDVLGLGFTATCSLVAVGADGSPVSVSWNGDSRRDIIVRMDHRAADQAERINSQNSVALQFYGRGVYPEMQAPKLLWVKENLQESWSMVSRWMDLSNWLTYRATGDDTRSLSHMEQWRESVSRDMDGADEDFWVEIGLEDLYNGSNKKIGHDVVFPGHPLGSGLTPASAKELGLLPGTPVGISLIDAYAGGIGVMESLPDEDFKSDMSDEEAICHRMVLVCGTSTCHMAVSKNKLFIPGVWGPFWSVMIPEFWLTECGQSATGALLDYVVQNHVAAPLLANQAASQSVSIYELMNKILLSMSHEQNMPFLSALSQDTHVLPDFHGNRSPVADPKSKGVICGLTLDTSEKQLALIYLATIQGIAYGTRHIVDHCNAHGHKIDTLLACGGLAKNSLYIQEHADITGRTSLLLLGAAILGAVAAKKFSGARDAMKALNAAGKVVCPSSDPRVKKYHEAKYQIFRSLYDQQLSHRSTMVQALQ